MKRYKLLDNRTLYFYSLIILILFSSQGFAQKKKKKKRPKINIEISLATNYDDNILKYSDKYIDRFVNREDEGRFHIKSRDDIVINPALGFSSTMKIFGKKKSTINADFSRKQYSINDIKSWNYFTVGFRQYLNKKLSFKFFYSHIPDFYINHYRDDDWVAVYGYQPVTFQRFSFTKDNFGFWIQNTFLKKTRIRLSFTLSKYYHNQHFTEYDCNNLVYAIKIYQPITKKIKLDIGYQFTNSIAKGYDEPGETLETSDDSDANHVEDRFQIVLNWQLPRLYKKYNSLNAECRIQNRYYSSHHYLENDPIHAGRVDENIRLYFTYGFKVNKKLKLSAFYYWFNRNSHTNAEENNTYLSNEKSYNQNQVGIKLQYSFRI